MIAPRRETSERERVARRLEFLQAAAGDLQAAQAADPLVDLSGLVENLYRIIRVSANELRSLDAASRR